MSTHDYVPIQLYYKYSYTHFRKVVWNMRKFAVLLLALSLLVGLCACGNTEEPETTAPSGIPDRPYCKGRAYDPNRYSKKNTEE